MKKFIMLIAAFLFIGICNTLFAQDILLLKSGDEIKVLVNEISTDLIKYKKFENPDGPLYVIEKNKVVMITYKNGSKDVFSEVPETKKQEQKKQTTEAKPKKIELLTAHKGVVRQNAVVLNKKEVRTLMNNNIDALELYNKGQKQVFVGEIVAGVGLGIEIVALIAMNTHKFNDTTVGIIGISGGVVCLATSMTVTFSGRKKIGKSVDSFNSGIKSQSSYNLEVGINQDGLALVFSF
jgi:hypothetical protein